MPPANDPLVDKLEHAALTVDPFEDDRMRGLVRARLFDDPRPETRIDRFLVLDRIGAGGMGIVYAAYDPQLDRKVAIKLLRASEEAGPADDRERMLGEARALARLSHPNVVAIYEVGLHGDRVFIAMEFVHGMTLRKRLAAGTTAWRDTVLLYLQAAEGLAAAHGAGLVHRDFKPDNAIVGDDGRVRVVDFGLARGDGAASEHDEGLPSEPGLASTRVGTPAYMAPEQRQGLVVGPQADQFGLCAALHEGLCGAPPKTSAQGIALALPSALPARLRRVLTRGLAVLPGDRFADMRTLASELRATTQAARRAGIAVAVAATLGVGVGGFVAASLERDPCPDPSDQLAGTWDEDARRQLGASAAALGDDATATVVVVERELDRRAQAWVQARRDACDALYVQRTQSQTHFDQRMRCLDRRRGAIADLLAQLVVGDASTWSHAVEATLGLASIDACSDPDWLASEGSLPSDPTTVAAIDRVQASIDQVETLEHLGRLADAAALATSTRDAALALGHRATEAQALRALASTYAAQGDDVLAGSVFADAAWRAEAGRADELAARILAAMMALEADRGEIEDAQALGLRVQGALERIAHASAADTQVLRARYMLAMATNDLDAAEAHARASLDARAAADDDDSLDVARDLNNLGLVQYERGDFVAAHATLERALVLKRAWLGPRHPDVLTARTNLASVDERQGHTLVAQASLEATIADAEAAHLSGPVLADALANLANLHDQAGRPAVALPLAERALAVWEHSVGPDDARILNALNILGNAYAGVGREADERACYERVLALAGRIDPDHPHKAYAWNNLAAIDREHGDFAAAVEKSTLALDLWSRTNGADHPVTGQLAYSLAQAEFDLGADEDARVHARQAIAILARGGAVDAPALAGAWFLLARSLWRGGTAAERPLALAAAEAALTVHAGMPGGGPEVAEIEAWLRIHRSQ